MSSLLSHSPAAPESARTDDPGTWRVRCVAVFVLLVWCVIAGRLIELQWLRHEELSRRAARIQTWSETLLARPGNILDRYGQVLATSTTTKSVFVDPHFVTDPEDVAAQLASALGLDAKVLADKLRQVQDKRFVWIKRRISEDEAAAVRELSLPREAVGFREDYRRHYPQGALAAHVLGLRGIDNHGHGGIEEGWDALLRGEDGRRTLQRDARGYVVDVIDGESQPPRHGADIVSTIDVVLQRDVERRLDELVQEWSPVSTAAIVMDPATGEVLAMASRPAFDPNHPGQVPPDAWRNQAIASVFEPGSTFKPMIVAWAMEQGLLEPDEEIHCEHGAYRMGRRVLHDHHSYGRLSVTDILVKSSNIGMAKIGERLTNPGLQAACRAFGFGRPTGIGLPGELPGLVRPFSKWDGYSTGSIPMGQELATTPLQLLTAHCGLAHGGRLMPPAIVRDTKRTASSIVTPVVSAETADWVVQGPMLEVVTRGTGKKAAIPGVNVFGKTGTSQVVDPQTGAYSHSRHICSFVCGAPAESPRAVVLVMVEEPQGAGVQYGGTVAAPPARDILATTLRRLDAVSGRLSAVENPTPLLPR